MTKILRIVGFIALLAQVACTGGGGSDITISLPSSLSFGQVAIGTTSGTLSVTLRNSGSVTFSLSGPPTVSGTNAADFDIVTSTCQAAVAIGANGTCVVTLTFTPSVTAAKSASLNFAIAGANTVSVALSGTGVIAVSNILPGQVKLSSTGNINGFWVTVTICEPGTANCQTIPNIEIDTGSTGLRLFSSVVTLPLTTSSNGLGQSLANCVQFADTSYAFGPVKLADIKMSGETALNQPIQIINQSGFAPTPNSCKVTGGTEMTSPSSLGGNGLLGVGVFRQDCGPACASSAIAATYYACSSSSCSATTMPLNKQLQNPVWKFAQDNNGLIFSLPTIGATGAATVDGNIIFGIGTQSNNALGSADVFTANSVGNISTIYNSNTYTSFIDSGSNGLFFLNSAGTSLPECNTYPGFYCPTSSTSFNVTNVGQNLHSANVSFSIQNAETLFNSHPTYAGFNNLGGPFPNTFDFGLSFFFGKDIFFGIEGQSVGSATGPLVAY